MDFRELQLPSDDADKYLLKQNKQELQRIFYKDSTFDRLYDPDTFYILGDKGSGKTAYAAYFCSETQKATGEYTGNIRSHIYRLNVDDYGKFIEMKKEGSLKYTDFQTIWKAVILMKLFLSIEKNDLTFFGRNKMTDALERLKNHYNLTEVNQDVFSPVTIIDRMDRVSEFNSSLGSSFDAERLTVTAGVTGKSGVSVTAGKESARQIYIDEWSRFLNLVKQEAPKIKLKDHHYLFIDGVDARPAQISLENYRDCVYALVNAVYEINLILSEIHGGKTDRLQVVLLTRLDIFMNSGMDKAAIIKDNNCLVLNWGYLNQYAYADSRIFKFIDGLLKTLGDGKGWDDWFPFRVTFHGSREYDSFFHVQRLTALRPREFIKLLQFIKKKCVSEGCDMPRADFFYSADFENEYSDYFAALIRMEMDFYYSKEHITSFFDFVEYELRPVKNIFKYERLKSSLQKSTSGTHTPRLMANPEFMIKEMYRFNMCCWMEPRADKKDKPIFHWHYRENNELPQTATENPEVDFIFHPGLEKHLHTYENKAPGNRTSNWPAQPRQNQSRAPKHRV